MIIVYDIDGIADVLQTPHSYRPTATRLGALIGTGGCKANVK